MARIVLTTFGSYGDLNPFLALGLELKRSGHEPVIAAFEGYRRDIERLGLGFAPVRPDIDRDNLALFERALGGGPSAQRRVGPMPVVARLFGP